MLEMRRKSVFFRRDKISREVRSMRMLFRPQLVSISFVCVVYHLMPDHVEVQASITKCY